MAAAAAASVPLRHPSSACQTNPTDAHTHAAHTAVQRLLAQKAAITNWNEMAASNNIAGWDVNTPTCIWSGVTCGAGGEVVML